MYQEWKELEKTSKWNNRCKKDCFKEKTFLDKLELPMDITKHNPEEILRTSKLIEWENDLIHLRQQQSKNQVWCAMGYDMRQEQQDKAKRKIDEESKDRKEREDNASRQKLLKVKIESLENE